MQRNSSDDDVHTRRDEHPCSRRVHNSGTVLHGVPVWLGILRLVSIELAQLFRIFLLVGRSVGRSVRRLSSLASVSPLPFHLGRNARARHRPFPRATNPACLFQVGKTSGMPSQAIRTLKVVKRFFIVSDKYVRNSCTDYSSIAQSRLFFFLFSFSFSFFFFFFFFYNTRNAYA